MYLLFPKILTSKLKQWYNKVKSQGGLIGMAMKKLADKKFAPQGKQAWSDEQIEQNKQPSKNIPAGAEFVLLGYAAYTGTISLKDTLGKNFD
jgi:hypothetical protein